MYVIGLPQNPLQESDARKIYHYGDYNCLWDIEDHWNKENMHKKIIALLTKQ